MSFNRLGRVFGLLAALAVVAPTAGADHLPENKVALGKADSTLCGIDVKRSSVADLPKLLGKPTAVRKDARVWQTQNLKIEVGIDRMFNPDNTPGKLYVAYVAVWGTMPEGRLGRTGRGLALGDTTDRLRELYGKRYQEKVNGVHMVSVEWHDTTGLEVEFDKNRRVVHMTLVAPE